MPETGTRAHLVPWSAMTLLSCVIVLYALLVLLHPHFGVRSLAPRRVIALRAWILAPHHREATV